MKLIIVILLLAGIYGCNSNKFEYFLECLDCDKTFCKTCDGTNRCVDCPAGLTGSTCTECVSVGKVLFNGVCSPCSEVSLDPATKLTTERTCTARSASDCKQGSGFLNGACKSCDSRRKGCETCIYSEVGFTCYLFKNETGNTSKSNGISFITTFGLSFVIGLLILI